MLKSVTWTAVILSISNKTGHKDGTALDYFFYKTRARHHYETLEFQLGWHSKDEQSYVII